MWITLAGVGVYIAGVSAFKGRSDKEKNLKARRDDLAETLGQLDVERNAAFSKDGWDVQNEPKIFAIDAEINQINSTLERGRIWDCAMFRLAMAQGIMTFITLFAVLGFELGWLYPGMQDALFPGRFGEIAHHPGPLGMLATLTAFNAVVVKSGFVANRYAYPVCFLVMLTLGFLM